MLALGGRGPATGQGPPRSGKVVKVLRGGVRQGSAATGGGVPAVRESSQTSNRKVIEKKWESSLWGGALRAPPPKSIGGVLFDYFLTTFPGGRKCTVKGRSTLPDYFPDYFLTTFRPFPGGLDLWVT